MRFYDLTVTDNGRIVKQWRSHPNGIYDPGAQNIEFDMIVTPSSTPSGGQIITIEGVSLNDLQQAQKYTGLTFVLSAGMAAGLPLANKSQQGIISGGFIFQSFGNWEGTEMTLTFFVYPSEYYFNNPANFTLNWIKNTPFSDALKQTIGGVYKKSKININISGDLKLPYDCVGFYGTLDDLAQFVLQISTEMNHPVYIVPQANEINIFDDTYKPDPVPIAFTDLIGQPTWISPNVMQVKTVLRADIISGSYINMPEKFQNIPGLISTRTDSMPSSMKYNSAFLGKFYVIEMRHIGNYRSPDGSGWATIMNCAVEGTQP
ncbi:hypothetical protein [Polynucleobacter sp. 39-46-10]|uniref:hypothetical protein n=1 Tax=Polynucleobacter sp. 39-46-10 TaxID=1970428 RepID=UPI0025F60A4D|nr:hypothetical protein [Polynucleobacter sp. 39-46-10]